MKVVVSIRDALVTPYLLCGHRPWHVKQEAAAAPAVVHRVPVRT
jgi:hypothetical protein